MTFKTCIVLAGGLGTRLRNAVPLVPKCLAPISDYPFLRWQLESLAKRGVEHFVLSLGDGAHQVLDAIEEPWGRRLNIEYVIEDGPLGTGGATYFTMINSNLDEALVINGDTFLGGSLDSMFVPLDRDAGELMRIAAVGVQDRGRFGGIEIDEGNHVVNFIEKGRTGAGQINAGFYRIGIQAFANESHGAFSLETVVMPKLLGYGGLQARVVAGPFIDIGVPDDYHHFSRLHKSYIDYK
jgi:D-glycero-alpha-D-manno-heptose 1-phosphate guanylyltransferase